MLLIKTFFYICFQRKTWELATALIKRTSNTHLRTSWAAKQLGPGKLLELVNLSTTGDLLSKHHAWLILNKSAWKASWSWMESSRMTPGTIMSPMEAHQKNKICRFTEACIGGIWGIEIMDWTAGKWSTKGGAASTWAAATNSSAREN